MWLNQALDGSVNFHRPTANVVPLSVCGVNVRRSPFRPRFQTVDLTAAPAGIFHREHSTRRAEHHGLSCLTISRYPTASVRESMLSGVSANRAILRPAIMSATFHGGIDSRSRIPDQIWPMRQWFISGGPYSALRWLATSPRARSLRVFSESDFRSRRKPPSVGRLSVNPLFLTSLLCPGSVCF